MRFNVAFVGCQRVEADFPVTDEVAIGIQVCDRAAVTILGALGVDLITGSHAVAFRRRASAGNREERCKEKDDETGKLGNHFVCLLCSCSDQVAIL